MKKVLKLIGMFIWGIAVLITSGAALERPEFFINICGVINIIININLMFNISSFFGMRDCE